MQLHTLGRIAWIATAVLGFACHSRGGIIHRVENGESLSQIAHVYDVPLRDLLDANPRIKSDELSPGQKILVPGAFAKRDVERAVWDTNDMKAVAKDDEEEEPPKGPAALSPMPKSSQEVKGKQRSVRVGPRKVLSFAWPAAGAVISKFGMRNRKMHNGIDIRVTPEASVASTAEGKVVYVGNDVEGYGNLLIIHHPTNLFSVYAYVGEILVRKEAPVNRGTVVAKANKKPQEAFLHFELRKGKRALDPLQLLPR